MRKKIVILALIIIVILIIYGVTQNETEPEPEPQPQTEPNVEESTIESKKQTIENFANVIMPTKSSRPGCEQTNSCYIPSKIEITAGESITWLNEDAAFHSVTSGTYENPNEMFDSGHLDPNESFTVEFAESGTFDYFCTLHPWMSGQVLVK